MHVPADQARVCLAHPRDRLAGRVVKDLDLVDRLIGIAMSEDGDVKHKRRIGGMTEDFPVPAAANAAYFIRGYPVWAISQSKITD